MNIPYPSYIAVLLVSGVLAIGRDARGQEKTFGQEVEFLSRHTTVITLASADGKAKVALAPSWQGRVMTSTSGGDDGAAYGWINDELVQRGIAPEVDRQGLEKHIHVFGGEERFWMGPEGGQFSLFFPPSTEEYAFAAWSVPAFLDTVAFDVESVNSTSVTFRKAAELTNQAGTSLRFRTRRTVELVTAETLEESSGVSLPEGVESVAFRSSNKVTNSGRMPWKAETGLPSIWMLGMFKPGDNVVMVIPFRGDAAGTSVNTDYFGEVSDARLVVRDRVAFFRGDGKFRSKIGIPASRARSFCGSYDPERKTLTLLHFNLPVDAAKLPYVRSQWAHHERPYAGDVVNCYNDGPPSPGAAPLGPFYELESSSPGLALAPDESYTHVQTTMHFQGDAEALDPIALEALGVDSETIVSAFEK